MRMRMFPVSPGEHSGRWYRPWLHPRLRLPLLSREPSELLRLPVWSSLPPPGGSELPQAQWRPLISPYPARYCALIGWDHGVATPRQLSYAIKTQLKAPKASYEWNFLPFAVSWWHKDSFHAGKGSITGAGLSIIMIPPIVDSFCACPSITVSDGESLTSAVLLSDIALRERKI